MAGKKIVCLGAGSYYFGGAIADLVMTKDLAGSEIVLYDLVKEKSERMAAMGKRLAKEGGAGFRVRVAADLADALDGADFALSAIGGSGAGMTKRVYMSYYHTADVAISAKYGIQEIIGDTCGPAAMMMGFRSIPVYLEICREMEKRCPNVILFSHSNPMATLCRAMHKYSDIQVIGVCHGVHGGVGWAAEILDVPPDELNCLWVGTNHYYWITRVAHRGKDLYPELIRRMAEREVPEGNPLCAKLSQIYGHRILYFADSHVIEFYPFLAQVQGGVEGLPYGLAEEAKEHFARTTKEISGPRPQTPEDRAEFFEEYQKWLDQKKLPERPSDPVTSEGTAAVISAIAAGRRQVCIANIANQGCIPNLPATAEVEVEAVTDSCGVRGLQMGEAPLALKGLLEKRFVWHELVADAAVKGDRNLALQALMTDEMAILPEKAEAMLDELLNASKDMLPQFFK